MVTEDFSKRRFVAAMNRLTKWRVILTGWQLGTRTKGDAESDAVRDHREATLILRAEVTAIVRALTEPDFNGKPKVLSQAAYFDLAAEEAALLDLSMETRFPGAKSTPTGIDLDLAKAQGWLKNFRP
jgi:hypothetical protein